MCQLFSPRSLGQPLGAAGAPAPGGVPLGPGRRVIVSEDGRAVLEEAAVGWGGCPRSARSRAQCPRVCGGRDVRADWAHVGTERSGRQARFMRTRNGGSLFLQPSPARRWRRGIPCSPLSCLDPLSPSRLAPLPTPSFRLRVYQILSNILAGWWMLRQSFFLNNVRITVGYY